MSSRFQLLPLDCLCLEVRQATGHSPRSCMSMMASMFDTLVDGMLCPMIRKLKLRRGGHEQVLLAGGDQCGSAGRRWSGERR